MARRPRRAGSPRASTGSSPGCGTPSTAGNPGRAQPAPGHPAPGPRPPVFLVDAVQLASDRVLLSGAEGRHAADVRRLTAGERVDLTDGAGMLAECVVIQASRGQLELAVRVRRRDPAPQPTVTVVQAIPKGDRGQLAVELITEVGADVIVPWAAERCVARWQGDRGERALARWRSTAREAAKQARRNRIPEITAPAGMAGVAARVAAAQRAVVLDPQAADSLAGMPLPGAGEVLLVVGPEGGISPAEAAALATADAVPAHLGRTVMRTSTAGAVAAALLLSRSGRWS